MSSAQLGWVIAEALAATGVREVVVCPGSRSTSIAVALAGVAADGRVRLHTRTDERVAGFLALGLARAGYPGALAAWCGFTLPSAFLLVGFALGLIHFGQALPIGALHGLKVAAGLCSAGVPMIVLETAQPAKFEATIEEALGRLPERPQALRGIEQLPQRVETLDVDVQAVKDFIAAQLAA